MGRKHKHSKDKLYKTVSELSSHHVGSNRELELSTLHRRLKFDTCCISLNNVRKKPMGLCDQEGFCYVFECDVIVNFLEKFNQIHPISGNKVSVKDLFELHFHKNDEGQYHCPITLKQFNQYSKIVANRKSGHVYSYQAYYDMNLTPKYFNDLLTNEPFNKNDIVTIQDSDKADIKWNVAEFYYIKNKLKLNDETDESKIRDIERSAILKSSLEEYKSRADEIANTHIKIITQNSNKIESPQDKLDSINSAPYSDGALSSSVTSTVMPIAQTQRAALLSEEQIVYPKIKKRAHVQLFTNFGPINLELYCDRTPKTCHNFLKLVSINYYDNTIFHRLIKNFILQGGDPTGTGSGGQSAWGKPFEDEFRGDLKHEGGGVLAMANSGPNTNKSQFYITLRGSWDHLDRKHTVFGRVVGGRETLDRIEAEVETDKNDRPKKEIKIIKATKYSDPFEEVIAAIEAERQSTCQAARSKKRPRIDSDNRDLHSKRTNSREVILDSIPSSKDTKSIMTFDQSDRRHARADKLPVSTSKLSNVNQAKVGNKNSSYGNFDNW